ncbi:hypothetical protein GlitD10_2883, partial [Gloeomargarita lithophora Alchichica-D10]
KSK